VVLERGEVANSWRTERWTRFGCSRRTGSVGSRATRIGATTRMASWPCPRCRLIAAYAKDNAAPVQTGTTVTSVRRTDGGYCVTTDQDEWHCQVVVLATGAFNVARIPAFAEAVPSSVATLTR